MEPNNKFLAVFNPFTRQLAVRYGNHITEDVFEEIEEWTEIIDQDDPRFYLHVQLDYDEHLQLLFYPRIDGDASLYEDLGTYLHLSFDSEMKKPENIFLVYTEESYNNAVKFIKNEKI